MIRTTTRTLCAGVGLALVLACGGTEGPATIEEASAAVELPLPPDATGVMLQTLNGVDPTSRLRFETADGMSWATAQGFDLLAQPRSRIDAPIASPEWWKPGKGPDVFVASRSLRRTDYESQWYVNVQPNPDTSGHIVHVDHEQED